MLVNLDGCFLRGLQNSGIGCSVLVASRVRLSTMIQKTMCIIFFWLTDLFRSSSSLLGIIQLTLAKSFPCLPFVAEIFQCLWQKYSARFQCEDGYYEFQYHLGQPQRVYHLSKSQEAREDHSSLPTKGTQMIMQNKKPYVW